MTNAERLLFNRITRRAAIEQQSLTRRLLASYRLIREALNDHEFEIAIRSGVAEVLIDQLMSDDVLDPALAPLRALIQRSTLDIGEDWSHSLPSYATAPMFNRLSPRIVDAVRVLDTRVMDGLKKSTRETLREAVRIGLEDGYNPRLIAKDLPGVVGLSKTQVRAVRNFKAELESGDRSALQRVLGRGTIVTPSGDPISRPAHAGGKGLGKRQLQTLDRKLGKEQLERNVIDKAVKAYSQRLLALNTETQTKSIALDTQRLGHRLAWESAIDQNIVDETQLTRTWVTAEDDRVRPEHAEMDGEEVEWDGTYSNGQVVPGESDYNCRCIERYSYKPKRT